MKNIPIPPLTPIVLNYKTDPSCKLQCGSLQSLTAIDTALYPHSTHHKNKQFLVLVRDFISLASHLTYVHINVDGLSAHPHGIVEQQLTEGGLANVGRSTNHHLAMRGKRSKEEVHFQRHVQY